MNIKYTHSQHQDQPSVMREARHPMRKTLTRVEDLFVDIHSEVKLSDLSAELTQSVRKMAARKSSDPAFWLHAFKFLNDFKDDIYTHLWTGKDETDHLARLALAQRSAAIQIRLLIRDKHLPPELQSALTHMFGPALALLMLRQSHDRLSRTLINAMQLVYEVIENYQESPISLDPYNRPAEVELAQRVKDFFKGITGIRQALMPEALTQLQSDDGIFLAALESDSSQAIQTELTAQTVENGIDDESGTLHLTPLASPVASAPEYNVSKPNALSAQQSTVTATHSDNAANDSLNTLSSTEVLKHVDVSVDAIIPNLEDSTAPLKHDLSEAPSKTDAHTPTNLALDALLERIMQEHRFTWFQVQASEESRPRRLMFGSYECEHQLVILVNVHQEPSLALSVADFDASLKAGLTRPLHDEPALNQLLLNYLAHKEGRAQTPSATPSRR